MIRAIAALPRTGRRGSTLVFDFVRLLKTVLPNIPVFAQYQIGSSVTGEVATIKTRSATPVLLIECSTPGGR